MSSILSLNHIILTSLTPASSSYNHQHINLPSRPQHNIQQYCPEPHSYLSTHLRLRHLPGQLLLHIPAARESTAPLAPTPDNHPPSPCISSLIHMERGVCARTHEHPHTHTHAHMVAGNHLIHQIIRQRNDRLSSLDLPCPYTHTSPLPPTIALQGPSSSFANPLIFISLTPALLRTALACTSASHPQSHPPSSPPASSSVWPGYSAPALALGLCLYPPSSQWQPSHAPTRSSSGAWPLLWSLSASCSAQAFIHPSWVPPWGLCGRAESRSSCFSWGRARDGVPRGVRVAHPQFSSYSSFSVR